MEMDALRVLVVDDSPIITRKICMMMDLIGYQVIKTAATGREAIIAYKECRPDVVTMDITMPDMSGIEATCIIKKAFPEANIIMVTSHGQEKMVLEALKAGAKGYVLKPFQQQKIFEAIEKACNRVVLHDKLNAVYAQHKGTPSAPTTEVAAPTSDTPDKLP